MLLDSQRLINFKVKSASYAWHLAAGFEDQCLDNFQLRRICEYAGVHIEVEDRQRIAHHQLIRGEPAIAFSLAGFGDNAANAAQIAFICDDLQLNRRADESFQGNAGVQCDAVNAQIDTVAYRGDTTDLMGQQQVVVHAVRQAESQP
ncbi:hypothetical protein GCM10027277_17330 [Pseudoduganella ginsengisoli]